MKRNGKKQPITRSPDVHSIRTLPTGFSNSDCCRLCLVMICSSCIAAHCGRHPAASPRHHSVPVFLLLRRRRRARGAPPGAGTRLATASAAAAVTNRVGGSGRQGRTGTCPLLHLNLELVVCFHSIPSAHCRRDTLQVYLTHYNNFKLEFESRAILILNM